MLEHLGDGDEAKMATIPFQEHIDRFDHRLPVGISPLDGMVEGVVEKNHSTGFDLIYQPVSHPVCVVIEPIISDHAPGDNLVAEPQGIEAGCHALIAIRRAEQPLPIRGDGPFAGAELCPPFLARDQRERRVIPGMIADRMAGLCDPSDEVWVPLCGLADHKEGRARLMSLQDVKKAWGGIRMRPVVKGQSDHGVLCRNVGNGAHRSPRGRFEQPAQDSTGMRHFHTLLSTLAQDAASLLYVRRRRFAATGDTIRCNVEPVISGCILSRRLHGPVGPCDGAEIHL